MVAMNNNNTLQRKLSQQQQQQQQHQHCVKDKTAKQKSTKRAANMSYTNSAETITVTIAQEQTTTTTAAAANQCMATRWSTVTTSIPAPTITPTPMTMTTTTTTTTTTTKNASSATIYRKYDNISGTRWTLGVGDTQMKLPWLLLILITTTATAEKRAQAAIKYSQPLVATSADNDDSFRPIIPKDISPEYISRNVFIETGQYRVFQSVDSDLRVAAAVSSKAHQTTTEQTTLQPAVATVITASTTMATSATTTKTRTQKASTTQRSGTGVLAVTAQKTQPSTEYRAAPDQPKRKHEPMAAPAAGPSNALSSEMKGLEELLVEYVQNFFNKGQYEPLPGLVFALHNNHTDASATAVDVGKRKIRPVRQLAATPKLGAANAGGSIRINIPRAIESGRLFFFSGLKKILWPIFMGLQILKSLLFAMFLPTLIGSFGKLLGKGIVSGSSPLFIRPAETPQDLDFRDNTFNFDDDNKFGANDESGNAYNQAEASQTQNQYVYNPAAINQQALSRYGNEQSKMQDSYLSALQSISSASFKNSNSISGSSSAAGGGGLGTPLRTKTAAPANTNTYQTFHKVPASSLLLSNYDPFYSPLLSRLDSVFAQLKLNSESESCREKLICLMYANPAKYAPYSNLVSAQLSRELNELRKPTSDNPDILRFFKYMRAAKDGQDGVDCEKSFDRCKEFKDFENPAMVSTYHDINKLVQARKLA